MAGIRTAPCDWPLAAIDCDALADLDYGVELDIIEMATAYLWNWTGRQFGLCDLTLRPCRRDCPDTPGLYYGASGTPTSTLVGPWRPVLIDGDWTNLTCGRCRDVCGCDRPSTIRLPGPVHAVGDVTIDGAILAPSAYRVDNRGVLVRQDGGTWPLCQKVGLPAGEVGTWSVEYTRGVPVPSGGQVAAAKLACEMAKAVVSPKDCGLPQRIQTVTREGVTVGFVDTFEGIEHGHTGIWLIDSWVSSVVRRPRRARVLSPDTMAARSTTHTPGP